MQDDGQAATPATPPHRVIEAWGQDPPQSEGWPGGGPAAYVDSQRFKT
jgi:hypothetical protein